MAKTRINKNELRRLKQKQAFSVATQVRLLVEQLANQSQYDAFLLQEPDVLRRKAMFEFSKKFVKFPNPTFPSTIQVPGIILTDK